MIKSKQEYKFYLKQDRIALGIQIGGGILFMLRQLVFPNKIWKFEKSLRRLEYYTNVDSLSHKILRMFEAVRFKRLSLKLGFSIPINVFGSGLSIAHYGTIVVNKKCKIGNNCRIHACVNIGASGGQSNAPVIGDNVYIGPGALLFGDISIPDNTTIAANATVNKSFDEEYCVLAGVPAKIAKTNSPNWIQFNHSKLKG